MKHVDAFYKAALSPKDEQVSFLKRILSTNSTTEYGSEHGFGQIDSYETFARNVPIVCYDDIKNYIERGIKNKESLLTSQDVTYYGASSGTTGRSKYIPVTKEFILETEKWNELAS